VFVTIKIKDYHPITLFCWMLQEHEYDFLLLSSVEVGENKLNIFKELVV
tara:strand:+ start:145 stop:291 length:147 start_codon:yes stop_codon:yes gene_type:complete